MKWTVSEMEGKTNFSRCYKTVSKTGIVECLEIIDVGCNPKRFDGVIWLTLTPTYFTTDLRQYIFQDFCYGGVMDKLGYKISGLHDCINVGRYLRPDE